MSNTIDHGGRAQVGGKNSRMPGPCFASAPRKRSLGSAVRGALKSSAAGAGVFVVGLTGYAHAALAGSPAVLELSSLDGGNGFVLNGEAPATYSGWAVSGAGDVNGDGIDDLIIGARFAANGTPAGEVYVVFGGLGLGAGGSVNLSALDGTNGFVVTGIDAYDYLGRVGDAGDVNGDGIDDLIIGAPFAGRDGAISVGESYVVFGSAQVGAGGSVDLSALNGTNGFVLIGITNGDYSGWSVNGAGDVNGDGIDDLIIGAPFSTPDAKQYAGEGYVVFGATALGAGGELELSSLNGTNGFVLNGVSSYDYAGYSVSAAGDVNGDGIADLIIGAQEAGPDASAGAGASYVVFGANAVGEGGSVNLASLDGTNGFTFSGIDDSDHVGHSVSNAGDVNGDGIADLIIGAERANPDGIFHAGESYVVFGGNGLGAGGRLDPASFDGTNGFVVNGVAANDLSGSSVSGAGDLNDDGLDDLIVGAPGAQANGHASAGRGYVLFGTTAIGAGGSVDLAALDGVNGFTLNGIDPFDAAGAASGVGDVNGDGIDDLIIGAPGAAPNGNFRAGESYVVLGRSAVLDTDADGVPDIADNCLLAANADQRDTDEDGIGNYCDADFNNDCSVNFQDLGVMKNVFFSANALADLDGNGSVNFVDLGILRAGFFQPPGPSGMPNVCDAQ